MNKIKALVSKFTAGPRYWFMYNLIELVTPALDRQLKSRWSVSGLPRPMTRAMRDYFGDQVLTGAEIGVEKGFNAESLLEMLNIERLYLVDVWGVYADSKRDEQTQAENYERVKERFMDDPRVVVIRELSHKAADLIEPESLDFCYIDACHKYKHVFRDIASWIPKVKPEGMIGGHDVINILDVLQASVDYSVLNGYPIEIDPPDWYFIKEKLERRGS